VDMKQQIEDYLNQIQTQRLNLIEATQNMMTYLHKTGAIFGGNTDWLRRLLRLLASNDIASLDELLQREEDIVVSIQKKVVYRHFEEAYGIQEFLLKRIALRIAINEKVDEVLAWRACMSIYITRTKRAYELIFYTLEHGVVPKTYLRKVAMGSSDTDDSEASEHDYYDNSKTDQWESGFCANENQYDMLIEEAVNGTSIIQEQCGVSLEPVIMDEVFFTAVGPKEFQRDEYNDVTLVMYEDEYRHILDRIKENYDGNVTEHGSGAKPVAKQTMIRVTIESSEKEIRFEDERAIDIWVGKYLEFHFWVLVPQDFQKKQFKLTLRVFADGIRLTTLQFYVKCNAASQQKVQPERWDVKSVFVSYARADAEQVTSLVRGMEKVRPDLDVFMDVDRLRSGQNWQEVLKAEIERRDMLFLCWSPDAKVSKWVDFEWRHMYNKRGIEHIDPIPLISPQSCPPPKELEVLHFDDRWLHYGKTKALAELEEQKTAMITLERGYFYIRNFSDGRITVARKKSILIGRGKDVDFRLLARNISRHHMKITIADGRNFRISDLNSTSGSFLVKGNRKIPPYEITVKRGTKIRLADEVIEIL